MKALFTAVLLVICLGCASAEDTTKVDAQKAIEYVNTMIPKLEADQKSNADDRVRLDEAVKRNSDAKLRIEGALIILYDIRKTATAPADSTKK